MFIRLLALIFTSFTWMSIGFSFNPLYCGKGRKQMLPTCNSLLVLQSSNVTIAGTTTGQEEEVEPIEDELSESELRKIEAAGCLDLKRDVKITALPLTNRESNNYQESEKDTKIIHFQRHGQGTHNELYISWTEAGNIIDWDSKDPQFNPLLTKDIIDSPLTEVGIQQCIDRQSEASTVNPELVIVSPLRRAIQSAELTWDSFKWGRENEIPWIAHEGCREEYGLLQCNKRRPKSVIQKEYPQLDLTLMVSETDSLFIEDRRETDTEKANRIYDFLTNYVRKLPQREIAVVCHSAWLFNMCNAVMDIQEKELKSWFTTSEIRSMKVTFRDVE